MAELIRKPRVMHKAMTEVRHAFAMSGVVSEVVIRDDLKYLHLVIMESLRLHPPVPLLIPRECREPCQVAGYDVPRGMQVLVNAWALGRDERYWPDGVEKFRPERFECDSKVAAEVVDFRGSNFELVPFGAGRRMCPGMAFALSNAEITLASLLFHFDWVAPGVVDPAELDMTEVFGVTTQRKAKLPLRPILRVPVPDVNTLH
uniref:Cytochrome P450 n=1 Tax=Leersia perrieri TaxID=77586 RepID=A0A0D9XXR2_9ORYZ